MKTIATPNSDIVILFSGMLICGLVAVLLGKDLSWDMANYHYYNAYAVLHQRWLQDYWPASFTHVNFSPSADLITYYLINTFSPAVAVYLSGALQGIGFFFLYKIARLFLVTAETEVAPLLPALLLAFLGMWQTLVFFALGSFQNDLIVSVFVLGFFYFSCIWVRVYAVARRILLSAVVLSGILLGISAGLKLTAAIFIIGAGTGYVCLPINSRAKLTIIFIVALATTLGFLLVDGYWLLNLWQRFHNPFYPFLSHWSQGGDTHAHVLGNYLPNGIFKRLFFPFYPSTEGDTHFHEFQFPTVYILFVISAAITLVKKFWQKRALENNLLLWWFYSFFIFSYLIWENYFGVARYVRPLAMLAPLLIFLLMKRALHVSFWINLLFVFTLTFATILPYQRIFRYPVYHHSYFNVILPKFVAQTPTALVLMSYPEYAISLEPRPLTYLIPFFPAAWRFVGIPMSGKKATFLAPDELMKIKQLIQQNTAKFYLTTGEGMQASMYKVAAALGLQAAGECEMIHSDRQFISQQNTYICPLKKN